MNQYEYAVTGTTAHMHDLKALLQERVAIDNIAVGTEDGPMCGLCGATWKYEEDTTAVRDGTEWHKDNCWVVRVRAVIGVQP